jgi:Zn-dependent protease
MDRTRLVSTQPQQRERGRASQLAMTIGSFAVSFVVFAVGFGSWKFGLGFVLLILVHELGHVFEARRQGLQVSLPTFIPLFGAYVRVQQTGVAPWRGGLVSLAGPFVGGLGAAAVWAVGSAQDSHLLIELAYIGFLLNAGNLLPIGFLDGGAIFRSIRETWQRPSIRYENGIPVEAQAPDHDKAVLVAVLYGLVGAALLACVLITRHSAML